MNDTIHNCADDPIAWMALRDWYKEAGEEYHHPTITNSVGIQLSLIPSGTYLMGSPTTDVIRSDEKPQHEVEISQPFYLGIFQITQAQYERIMGSNPSHFKGADLPVESVSWDDAVEYCKRLSALPGEKQSGLAYRLPTEAEWEYACRAGTTTIFSFGDDLSSTQANFDGNHTYGGAAKGPYLQRTSKVGSYKPNAWGLYDMHGNVWEWCLDWYDEDFYGKSQRTDPVNTTKGSYRVIRGGSWYSFRLFCRSASRSKFTPKLRFSLLGFRVALTWTR